MGANSKIEWTDNTWNPISGCTQISEGCQNCYAKEMARRFAGQKGFPNGFNVTFFPDRLDILVKWKKPRTIFVCSTGDLFHKDVKDEWIFKILETICKNDHHTYFILTKRPERMKAFLETCRLRDREEILNNVWFGTSVENNSTLGRMKTLSSIKGINRFVSFEPLLERLYIRSIYRDAFKSLHWVICGAETGRGARAIPSEAPYDLLRLAREFNIPYFFKKWNDWRDNPDVEMIPREFPDFGKGDV